MSDESSVLGSIGVISAGFGFHELIERYGIERRVHTQGARKAMLDPFAPEKPEDVRRLEAIQKDIHRNFKDLVRARRQDRLKASERKLFSGDVWTGKEALALANYTVESFRKFFPIKDKKRLDEVSSWLKESGIPEHIPREQTK